LCCILLVCAAIIVLAKCDFCPSELHIILLPTLLFSTLKDLLKSDIFMTLYGCESSSAVVDVITFHIKILQQRFWHFALISSLAVVVVSKAQQYSDEVIFLLRC